MWRLQKGFEALDKVFTAMKQGEGKSFYPLNLTQGDGFSGLLSDYDGLTLGLQPIGVRYDDANRRGGVRAGAGGGHGLA